MYNNTLFLLLLLLMILIDHTKLLWLLLLLAGVEIKADGDDQALNLKNLAVSAIKK